MLALSLVKNKLGTMVNMLQQLTYSYVQVKLTMVVNILLKYASKFRNDYEYPDKFYSSLEYDALFDNGFKYAA
jgi:hypothetical protein